MKYKSEMAEGPELQSSSITDADDIGDTSDAAQIAEVQAWLNSMFEAAGKEIPKFEYTSKAVAHLYNVARVSQDRTHASEILRMDLRDKAAEYHSQAARMTEILDGIGLAFENLSKNALASIKFLGTVANLLDIKDPEMTSFLIGMGDLLLRKIDVEEQRTKAMKESNELLENIRKAITHLTHLKRAVAELEEEISRNDSLSDHRRNNNKVMESKKHQYMVQHSNYKTILNRVGYSPEISHGVLMQLVGNRKDLETKAKPILETLRTYQDLPPDITLAELAIQDKRRQCEEAERQLEDLLLSALNSPIE